MELDISRRQAQKELLYVGGIDYELINDHVMCLLTRTGYSVIAINRKVQNTGEVVRKIYKFLPIDLKK